MKNEDKKEIEALLLSYKDALNASDAKAAVALYVSNGVFMPTEAPSAVGTAQILGAYQFVFSQIQLSIEFFVEEIVVQGEMAYAVTNSKGITLIHANGQTVPEENRELFVFEKQDGSWKIARYMFNKTQAAATTDQK
jgi:uncharacterized protein (TIGR02246 family)